MTQQTDLSEPTNVQRAQWAKAALAVFTAETYSGDHPDTMHPGDLESAIGDLICDLLHLARYQPRLDPTAICSHALSMFETELAEEELCDCADRSWYGAHHDTACPVSITAAASTPEEGGNCAQPVPDWLEVLLDIKRLAEKSGDHEADPWTLLDLIADEARSGITKATKP